MAEEKLAELYNSGEMRSLMHLSIGQEAVAVGVCSALDASDSVVSTHRCHAHYLAKGGSMKRMFAELAGKKDGCAGGKGGSMHLFDVAAGLTLSTPIVAGSIPIAVGIGLSIKSVKLKGKQRISVAFFGDGAVEQGVFWESLNFAAIHRLPVVFICENNQYATHAHLSKRQPPAPIWRRAQSFGIDAQQVDGNDVECIASSADDWVRHARESDSPVFVEALTYRWREHWGPGEDWRLGYRSEAEGKKWKERCPIERSRASLILRGTAAGALDAFAEEIREEIAAAIRFAKESPEPKKEELLV